MRRIIVLLILSLAGFSTTADAGIATTTLSASVTVVESSEPRNASASYGQPPDAPRKTFQQQAYEESATKETAPRGYFYYPAVGDR